MDCINFLDSYYGQKYVDIFNYIIDGPIKADFWRVCILYKFGGVYCDIDVEPLVPIDSIIEPDVHFLTCISMTINKMNPHIIISYPNNNILKECINTYINYYDKKLVYRYHDWSIIDVMTPIIYKKFNKHINMDNIYIDENGHKYQFIKEHFKIKLNDIYCVYNNKRILNNRYSNYNPSTHEFNL